VFCEGIGKSATILQQMSVVCKRPRASNAHLYFLVVCHDLGTKVQWEAFATHFDRAFDVLVLKRGLKTNKTPKMMDSNDFVEVPPGNKPLLLLAQFSDFERSARCTLAWM